MKKDQLKVNSPIIIGETVLDFIRILIYKFYYDYMILKWDEKILSFFIRLLNLMPIMETLSMMLNNLTYQIMMKKRPLPTGRNK